MSQSQKIKDAISERKHITVFSLSNKFCTSGKNSDADSVPQWWYSKCRCVASIELGNLKYVSKCRKQGCEFETVYALYRLSKLSECFEILEQHSKQHPSHEGLSLLLPQCYYKDEQFEKAAQQFGSLYKSFSDSTELESLIAVNYLASIYRTSHPTSSSMIHDIVSSHSSSYDVLHNMALVYLMQGDITSARDCMKRSLQLFEERLDSKLQLQFIEFSFEPLDTNRYNTLLQYWTELLQKRRDNDLSIASALILASNILSICMNYQTHIHKSTDVSILNHFTSTALGILNQFKTFITPTNIKTSVLNRSQITDIIFNISMFYLLRNTKEFHMANRYIKYIEKMSHPESIDTRLLVLSALSKILCKESLESHKPQSLDKIDKDYEYILSYNLLLLRRLFERNQIDVAQLQWSDTVSRMVQYITSGANINANSSVALIKECVVLMIRINEDKVIDELLNPIIERADRKSLVFCHCLALKGKIFENKHDMEQKFKAIDYYKTVIIHYPRGSTDTWVMLSCISLHLCRLLGRFMGLTSYSKISSIYEWLRVEAIPSIGILSLIEIATLDKESSISMDINALLKYEHVINRNEPKKKRKETRMKRLLKKYGSDQNLPSKKNWSRSNDNGPNWKKQRRIQKKKKTGTQGMISASIPQES